MILAESNDCKHLELREWVQYKNGFLVRITFCLDCMYTVDAYDVVNEVNLYEEITKRRRYIKLQKES